MAGIFEITKRKNGELQFNLKAVNGQVILTSEGYTRRDGVVGGIASVRTNSKKESNFERRKAKNGDLYFVLKAQNGQVIGNSEMYKTPASVTNGIKSVRTNAPTAKILDLSK